MDQHPIPQDVTGFQFKLIGTMTVKQFGYVACGVVMAVIVYYLPLNSALGILAKVLLVPLLGGSGAFVAFVPIDGRPVDVMTTNFVKAIFSPNQYIYHRQGRKLSFTEIAVSAPVVKKQIANPAEKPRATTTSAQLDEKEEKLRALLLNSHSAAKNTVDQKEAAFLHALEAATPQTQAITAAPRQAINTAVLTNNNQAASGNKPVASAPQILQMQAIQPQQRTPVTQPPSNETKENQLTKKEIQLEQALMQAKQEDAASNTPMTHAAAQQKMAMISKQIQDVHTQKETLEKELSQLKQQLSIQKAPPVHPTAQPVQDPQHVRAIPQSVTKKIGLPHVSDSPNVVVGIVKDPRGNIVPNILVEIKDKEGNPIRAFKTNQLGQFASATPLSPGTYTMELEDPKKQHRFDVIQITANNQIMSPIEIISHDEREDLRKQLFAN